MKSIAIALLVIFNLLTTVADAQPIDNVKIGMGVSFLGSGDVFAGKLEGEVTKNYNSIISGSALLGLGHGASWGLDRVYQRTFTTHLDGNVFISPFGNDKVYNFKIGSGLSLMYVMDRYPGNFTERRVSLGVNMIVEQEVVIHKKYLLGLKAIVQPYWNGDIASSLLIKFGKKR